jgi:Concanavalin A-like lectin/glucanases superfamily
MKNAILLLVVLIIASVSYYLGHISSQQLEGFARELKPCRIYYTDNIAACNYSTHNLYSMSDADLRQLKAANPNADYVEHINTIIDERSRPNKLGENGKVCKVDIPGLVQPADAPVKYETMGVNTITNRGPKEQWSFCFREVADANAAASYVNAFPSSSALMIDSEDLADLDMDKKYKRVTVADYTLSNLKPAVCALQRDRLQNIPMLIVFEVEPYNMVVKDVSAVNYDMSSGVLTPVADVRTVFSQLFQKYTSGNIVAAGPIRKNVNIYKFTQGLCNKPIKYVPYSGQIDLTRVGLLNMVLPSGTPMNTPVDVTTYLGAIKGKSLLNTNITQSHMSDESKVYIDVGIPASSLNVTEVSVISAVTLGMKKELPAPLLDYTRLPVFSIATWIRILVAPTNKHYIFIHGESPSDITHTLYVTNAGDLIYDFNGATIRIAKASLGALGLWFHFAVVVNATSITPYLNGVAQTGHGQNSGYAWSTFNNKRMYMLWNDKDQVAEVDHFYWYNKVIALSDIQSLRTTVSLQPDKEVIWYSPTTDYVYRELWSFNTQLRDPAVYTASLWINVAFSTNYWRNVLFFGKYDDWRSNSTVDRTPGIWIFPESSSFGFSPPRIHIRHRAKTPKSYDEGVDIEDTSKTAPCGVWFHLGVVVNVDTMTAYINGSQVSSQKVTGPFEWNLNLKKQMMLIKDRAPGVLVQKAYWYRRALNASEIKALAQDVEYAYPNTLVPPVVLGAYNYAWGNAAFADKTAKWIWNTPNATSYAPTLIVVSFRRQWTNTSKSPIDAILHVVVDDFAHVHVNSKYIRFVNGGWTTASYNKVPIVLQPGDNVVQFDCWSGAGAAGLIYSVIQNGTVLFNSSNETMVVNQ